MKIAFINVYQNNIRRGSETFVMELSKRFSKNYQVDIISANKSIPERWPFLWRTYLDPQGLSILFFTLKNIFKVLSRRYDVVIPLNGGWQPRILRIVTWLYGGKMIISGQSGDGWDDRNNLWSFPDVFVSLSSKSSVWAKRTAPFVKTVYIPNGVDTKRFTPIGKKIETGLKHPIVLCVGALTKQKRIDLVISAVSKLNDVSLLVVGDGPLKSAIQSLGEKSLGNRFRLINALYKDMPQVYRAGDVFTLVSESSESFGNVFVEAMASGLPVVARSDEKRKEIIGGAGALVDPENKFEYADTLKKVLSKDFGDNPRKQAERFDWDNASQKYEELFSKFNKKI